MVRVQKMRPFNSLERFPEIPKQENALVHRSPGPFMIMRPNPADETSEAPLTPDQERVIAKFRRFSSVSMLIMFVGVIAVLGVISYRMLRTQPIGTGQVTAMLPAGAKVLSTAVSGDVVVVTLDVAGSLEIRTFDARTLAPGATLRFATQPAGTP